MNNKKEVAQAIKKSADDAYWSWDQMCPAEANVIAVAVLREVINQQVINQLQQCSATPPAFISCPDLLEVIEELEKL